MLTFCLKCSIIENENPFPFPTISICAEPFENLTKLKELGLPQNVWNLVKHETVEDFMNWPINNSLTGANIWEETTFGFWEMIHDVSMSFQDPGYILNRSEFSFEDENGWLYAKVRKPSLII